MKVNKEYINIINVCEYMVMHIEELEKKKKVTDKKRDRIIGAIIEFDKIITLFGKAWGEDLFIELQMYKYYLSNEDERKMCKSEIGVRYMAIWKVIALAYSYDKEIEGATKIYTRVTKTLYK